MTTRERKENAIERRRNWAAGRENKSSQAFAASTRAVEGIPMGQPILVGHHSERGHRAAISRCHSAMNASMEHSNMAATHTARANGIERQLKHTIFSDDTDAISTLEKRIAGREEQRDFNNRINKIIRSKPKNDSTPEKIAALKEFLTKMSDAALAQLFAPDCCGRIGIPSYVNANLSGNISTDRKRLAQIKAQAVLTEAAAESVDGINVTLRNGWAIITFEDKPDWETRKELKDAGFRWRSGSWQGSERRLPDQYRTDPKEEVDPACAMVMEATGEDNY